MFEHNCEHMQFMEILSDISPLFQKSIDQLPEHLKPYVSCVILAVLLLLAIVVGFLKCFQFLRLWRAHRQDVQCQCKDRIVNMIRLVESGACDSSPAYLSYLHEEYELAALEEQYGVKLKPDEVSVFISILVTRKVKIDSIRMAWPLLSLNKGEMCYYVSLFDQIQYGIDSAFLIIAVVSSVLCLSFGVLSLLIQPHLSIWFLFVGVVMFFVFSALDNSLRPRRAARFLQKEVYSREFLWKKFPQIFLG